MNFGFDLNTIIPYEVTKYNSDLKIIHPSEIAQKEYALQLNRDLIQKLCYIIDRMGEASSKAQSLKEIITTSRKLTMNDQHKIFLMKDANANKGLGSVVGLLKVGEKNLFIHDYLGRTHEMSPLCVLDFFVSETEQRKGYGKQLFDCMLRMQNVLPEHLAIDKPSEKSIRFLRKHYNLKNPIGQVNNFVVFDGFFDNRTDQNNTNLFGKRKQSGSNKQQQQRIYDVLSAVPSSIQQYGSTRSNSNYTQQQQSPPQYFLNRGGSVDARLFNLRNNNLNEFGSGSYSNLRNISNNENQINSNKYLPPQSQQHQQQQSPVTNHFLKQSSSFSNSRLPSTNDSSSKNSATVAAAETAAAASTAASAIEINNNINKYNPFPSLNKKTNNYNMISSKPPLPHHNYSTTNNATNHAINTNLFYSEQNLTRTNTFNSRPNYQHQQQQQFMRTNTSNSNHNVNIYDPFPSLSTLHAKTTVPEFYSNIGSKFQKTKLW